MLISKSSLVNFIGIILFKLALDYTYVNFVEPVFAYSGFTADPTLSRVVEGWVAYIVVYLILIKKKTHTLYPTILITYLLLITPTVTLYSLKGENAVSFYMLILTYIVTLLLITEKYIKLPRIKNGRLILLVISITSCVLILINYSLVVGLSNINFDLKKVYSLRSEYGSQVNSGIFAYLNGWVMKVFSVLLIVWTLKRKQFFFCFLSLVFIVLLFGFSGHKMVLFTPALIFGLYIIDKSKHSITILIYGSSLTVISLFFYYVFTDEILLPSILIRRVFFLPASLNYTYIDFFEKNELIYWSNSFMKSFLNYPYKMSATHVIGEYLGNAETGANTGILGSGFMHFGSLGLFIYSVLLAAMINSVNSFKNNPAWFTNSIYLMPILTAFISSDLITTIFTHGFLVSFLVLYFYSSEKEKTLNAS